MFGQPDGKQQRYQSAQHGQRQSSHMGTPPRSPLAQQLGRVAKMRSTLCAGSYTLRAIFRPWKPTGPNRYSLKGWILGPSRFSCPYSPECVEGEFSEVGLLTDSCWIHRCWLGCERGRALSRGPFLSPPGVPCPYPSLYTTLGECGFYELRIDGVLIRSPTICKKYCI